MEKNKLRKIIAVGATLSIALILAACGPQQSKSTIETDSSQTQHTENAATQNSNAIDSTQSTELTSIPSDVIEERPTKVELNGSIFGTTYSFIYFSDEIGDLTTEQIQKGFDAVLKTIDKQMSTYIPNSDLNQFNKFKEINTKFEVPEDLYNLVAIADKISNLTDHKYDITILPLVNAWGFGPKNITHFPTEEEIKIAQQSIGHNKLKYTTENGKFFLEKTVPDLTIDLSSIAKGFAVDKGLDYLKDLGAKNALVEIGGELKVIGKNAFNKPWNIAIELPDSHLSSQKLVDNIIPLTDNSLATSGDYRNFTYQDGKRISHTIDPITGHPITHLLASVSVINESNTIADAYATALNIVGPERAMEIAKQQNLAVFLIIYDGKGFIHQASPEFIRITKEQ